MDMDEIGRSNREPKAERYVSVTLRLKITNFRKLRAEAYKRTPEMRIDRPAFTYRELAQSIVDDAKRLGLDDAGLEIVASESEEWV